MNDPSNVKSSNSFISFANTCYFLVFVLFCFIIIAISTVVKWYLIMVLIYILLVTNDAEHLLMGLLAFVQMVLDLWWLDLKFFIFMMVKMKHTFSRKCTSDFELWYVPELAIWVWPSLTMLGSSSKPELSVSHVIMKVNNCYPVVCCVAR